MKIAKLILLIFGISALVVLVGKVISLNNEIDMLGQERETILASLNQDEVLTEEVVKEEDLTLQDLTFAEDWLTEPTDEKEEFERVIEILCISTGRDAASVRDAAFKRYIDYTVTQKFSTYLSASGIRTYRAQHMTTTLLSQGDLWSQKYLYKPPQNNVMHTPNYIPTVDVVIPSGVMTSQTEFSQFLQNMEEAFGQ